MAKNTRIMLARSELCSKAMKKAFTGCVSGHAEIVEWSEENGITYAVCVVPNSPVTLAEFTREELQWLRGVAYACTQLTASEALPVDHAADSKL